MVIVIWIRHGNKLYDNNKGPKGHPRFDPDITDQDKYVLCPQKGNEIYQQYGIPDMIIVSPYLRTRTTAYHLYCNLTQGNPIDTTIDENISEYLGNQRRMKLHDTDFDVDTIKYDFPDNKELYSNISIRTQRHLDHVLSHQNKFILVVTHGLIIKSIANHFNIKIDDIQPLQGIIYYDGVPTLFNYIFLNI